MNVYFTESGEPPNGAIPPGLVFFADPRNAGQLPVNAEDAPPVAINITPPVTINIAPPPPGPAPPAPPAKSAKPAKPAQAAKPSPTQAAEDFQIPGTKRGGASFIRNGAAYIFPKSSAIINFFADGTRPFERPPGSTPRYATLEVPTMITVAELMRLLGVPSDNNDRYGITECFEADNDSWTKGRTFILSEDKSKSTLQQVGWDDSRGTKNEPVWLAIHNKAVHGPT